MKPRKPKAPRQWNSTIRVRDKPPKRGGWIKPKKRTASEYRRIYGSRKRVEWIKSYPCLVCFWLPSDNAHTENGGMGKKAGYATIIPLCRAHHRRYDEHQHPFDTEEMRMTARAWAVSIEQEWRRASQGEG